MDDQMGYTAILTMSLIIGISFVSKIKEKMTERDALQPAKSRSRSGARKRTKTTDNFRLRR
jgi:hypothetical protein